MDLDPDRWWIFTDTSDVIFQRPVPDLDIFGKPILVCNERQLHDNAFWYPVIHQFIT